MKTCENCSSLTSGEYGSGRFCSAKCARGFSTKNKRKEINEKLSTYTGVNNSFYKSGKISNQLIKKCKLCKTQFYTSPSENNMYCSRKCYKTDPNTNKGTGGLRRGTGRGKKGWYNGYWCDSSYELAYVIYNLDHDIKFKRNTKGFEYEFNGKTKKYYPDFILGDGEYVEIKGFWQKSVKAKIDQFPHKIKILFKTDLTNIFEYVTKKYGTNFIELYEGNPHNEKNNSCEICKEPCKNKYCSRQCTGIGVSRYKARSANG